MKKLFKVLNTLLKLQSKITPNEDVLKTIYLISFVVLAAFTQNELVIFLSLFLCIFVILKHKFPKKDKLQHYYIGILIFLTFGIPMVNFWGFDEIWYIIPCVILGGLKEILDYFGLGNAEEMDFIKTIQFSVVYYILIIK